MSQLSASVLTTVTLALASAASAQGLRPDALAMFGGRYALDCAKADSSRVLVEVRQMRIEQGSKRITVGNLDSAFSYFGQNPPPDFRVALLGQMQGWHEVVALVNADGTAKHPSELIRDPRFKPAYRRALGPLSRTPWLGEMNGPAPDLRQQRIGGVDYTVAAFCQPHDCGDNNAVLLYDAAQGRVYGLLQQKGKTQTFGSPPGPLLIDLNAIWRRERGQGR
jgi:hypothetical protein